MNGSTQPGGLIQVIRYEGSASVPAAPKAAPAKPSSGASHGKGH